jgi:DNA-binding NarL/FixJ family response regulator
MVTVGLADDHVVVRQGLRLLLESDPTLNVVGEAASGTEALDLARRLKPQVLILDLMMPAPDGLEVTRRITRQKLGTRVIILTMYGDPAFVLDALKGGAAGYVVKESCGTELLQAIHEVAEGRRYLSPALDTIVREFPAVSRPAAATRTAAKPRRQPSRAL